MAQRPMLTLRATQGQDEANYGTERFRVDNNGDVDVPLEAVDALTGVGGFERIKAPVAPPAGMVHLAHAEGVGCSWRGVSYEPDDHGVLTVPAEAAAELAPHGFTAPPEAADDDDATGDEANATGDDAGSTKAPRRRRAST